MLSRLSTTALALGLVAAVSAPAHAQAVCGNTGSPTLTCSPAGISVSGTLQTIIVLSVTNPAFALNMPINTDFVASGDATMTQLGAQVATVRANAAWTLTVQGAAWTGSGNNAKLIADLEWTSDGGTGWTPMTVVAANIATGPMTSGTATTVGYRTTWHLVSDTPGTYSQVVTYTLSAP